MLSPSQIFGKVRDIIYEILGAEFDTITPDAHIADDFNADSLDQMELVLAYEEEFGIGLADEDLSRFATVQDVIDYLLEKGV